MIGSARSDYNPNASAHRVKEPQYGQVNAVSDLIPLTSLLVEVDELLGALGLTRSRVRG